MIGLCLSVTIWSILIASVKNVDPVIIVSGSTCDKFYRSNMFQPNICLKIFKDFYPNPIDFDSNLTNVDVQFQFRDLSACGNIAQ